MEKQTETKEMETKPVETKPEKLTPGQLKRQIAIIKRKATEGKSKVGITRTTKKSETKKAKRLAKKQRRINRKRGK